MTDKGQQKRKMSKSSGGYKALLQSLDEDVSRGLGRSIALKSGSRKGRSCCCRCMRSWIVYACVALILASVLFLAIGIPMMLRLPMSSPYHWTHWKQMFYPPLPPTGPPDAADAADAGHDPQSPNNATEDGWMGNHTQPLFYDPEDAASGASGASGTHLYNDQQQQQALNLIQKAVVQMRQVIHWSKERYDRVPKIHLIIAATTLTSVTLAVLAVFIYRRLARRQRRRTIGKLVTDLQSGDNTLLLHSDSEDD